MGVEVCWFPGRGESGEEVMVARVKEGGGRGGALCSSSTCACLTSLPMGSGAGGGAHTSTLEGIVGAGAEGCVGGEGRG
jgi:hypothetical protein